LKELKIVIDTLVSSLDRFLFSIYFHAVHLHQKLLFATRDYLDRPNQFPLHLPFHRHQPPLTSQKALHVKADLVEPQMHVSRFLRDLVTRCGHACSYLRDIKPSRSGIVLEAFVGGGEGVPPDHVTDFEG
jgi:hypothetical protein